MKYFYLLLLGFLLPVFSFAQVNYRQGYVILSSGDTLSGYIDTREWNRNPETINFKRTLTDNASTVYTPANLTLFEVGGIDRFITYNGKLSMDATDINRIPPALDTNSRQAAVFLKVLTTGPKATLLSYTDRLKTRFFIQSPGLPPDELSYHIYSSEYNSMTIVNTWGYRGQLLQLANQYDADSQLKHLIQNADYGITDLKRIVNSFNGYQATDISKTPNGRLFIGGGVNYQNTAFSGNNLFTGISSTAVMPFFSAGYDIFANPNTKRIVFRGEFMVSHNSANFKETTYNYSTPDGSDSFNFNQLNFTVIPQVMYNIYSTDNLKFFLMLALLSTFQNTAIQNITMLQLTKLI